MVRSGIFPRRSSLLRRLVLMSLVLCAHADAASLQSMYGQVRTQIGENDKEAHFAAGFVGAWATHSTITMVAPDAPLMVRFVAPVLMSAVLGAAKEVFDRNWDQDDFNATVLGGASIGFVLRW